MFRPDLIGHHQGVLNHALSVRFNVSSVPFNLPKANLAHNREDSLIIAYEPIKDEAQTALFKDPVRTAL
jgi:hypothetical protein